jgi:hypothetical protein
MSEGGLDRPHREDLKRGLVIRPMNGVAPGSSRMGNLPELTVGNLGEP